MVSIASELRRLSHTLVLRGSILVVAGLVAIALPEELLIHAMTLVTVMAITTAMYESTTAVLLRRRTAAWWLVGVHSLTILAFGALTFIAPRTLMRAPFLTIAVVDLLLLVIAWQSISVALFHFATPLARWGLWLWAGVNVTLAMLAAVSPLLTIFTMLYFGAVYAAALGAVEIAAGISIARARGHHRRSAHRAQPALLS